MYCLLKEASLFKHKVLSDNDHIILIFIYSFTYSSVPFIGYRRPSTFL